MIRTPDAIRDEIRKARAAGESVKKLAKRFGLTVQTVATSLVMAGRSRWSRGVLKMA